MIMKKLFKTILALSMMLIFTQSLAADEQTNLKEHFLNKIDEVVLIVDKICIVYKFISESGHELYTTTANVKEHPYKFFH